jgi:hypothetical protein
MNRKLRVILLTASIACGLASASADDSFLQQPFKSYLFESKTYPDGVRELSRIIQKPVTIPDGAADFVKEINGWNIGFRIPNYSRIGRTNQTPTMRDVLDQTSSSLGMGWRYDASKDRVVLDFSWCREDPRTSAELLDVLEHSAPLSFASEIISSTGTSTTYKANPNQTYFWDHHHLDPNDKWRIAFDALLSKPENFRAVWKLRFADDMKRQCGYPEPVINLLSAKIQDQDGGEHLIILDDQPCPMNPGEGTMTYYVFDLNGKFEQGGIYNGGYRCHCASAWVEASATQVTVHTFFNYSEKMDLHFLLTKNGLVLHDVSDSQNQLSPSLWAGFHFGDSPFHPTN